MSRTTVIQICVGNAVAMAHKRQIRVCKEKTPWQGPTALIREQQHDTVRSNPTRTSNPTTNLDDEPPSGVPAQAPKGGRKRRRQESENDNLVLRRSKRVKKVNRKDDFHYD